MTERIRHCLCCDRTLLRHIDHTHIYWYCPHCRQAMPSAIALDPLLPQPALPVPLSSLK
ncbi:MAG: hypothetical protein AAFQ74_05965 [Cyanobacteria bacterium J06623_4]